MTSRKTQGIRRAALNQGRYAGLLDDHLPQQLDRLFLISLRRKYLYCPVSKVANSSIKAFLYEAELRANGFASNGREFTTAQVHNFLYGPLVQPFQLANDALEDILKGEDYFRFVFVRNPVDRLVSCYLDRVLSPGSVPHRVVKRTLGVEDPQDIKFADFVAVVAEQSVREMNPHWRPVYNEACCASVTYDAVLKFENLQAELRTLLDRLFPQVAEGIDLARNLSPAKTRAKERAADFITPELKTRIEAIYAKDYEAFGY